MDVIDRGRPAPPPRAVDLAGRLSWFNDELVQVRTTASTELAQGIRQLRDETRVRLAVPDPRYPDLLAAAVAELGRRYLRRTHDLTYTTAERALSGLDVAVPPLTGGWEPPALSPPPHRARWSAEERAIAATSVFGAATLARWPLMVGALPAPLAAGVSVSLVLGIAWALASTKRAGTERARLQQWTAEVLHDTHSVLESAFTQRLVDAKRRMRHVLAAHG